MPSVTLSGEDAQVVLELSHALPQLARWESCSASVQAPGGFRGAGRAFHVGFDELGAFAEALACALEKLTGTVTLDAWVLAVCVVFQDLGHVAVTGHIVDSFNDCQRLQFSFSSDQSYLMQTLADARTALAAVPASDRPA